MKGVQRGLPSLCIVPWHGGGEEGAAWVSCLARKRPLLWLGEELGWAWGRGGAGLSRLPDCICSGG